ncbi:MAG: 2-dehydropantoate 2-reductase [Chitinivibrionales bacterium]|nr:2-dehydropantoate 2-reductase [Chitinivibrionales bacterium]
MNILIFGAGAVGLGLASCLVKAGCRVSLKVRPSTRAALTRHGLVRTGIFGRYDAPCGSFELCDATSEAGFDFILVCVKSFDTQDVAQELASWHCVKPGTRIVLCQNGWGNVEIMRRQFSEEQVFAARVITGFRRIDLHHVDITVHAAPIHVGHLSARLSHNVEALCRKLNEGGLPSQVSATMVQDLWAKVLYNALLNPLGALLDVHYGALGESAHTREIMAKLAHEAFTVLQESQFCTHWTDTEAFLFDFYEKSLPPTAAHESSMLQDLRNGKRTEIDAINGAITRLGGELGITTPVNDMIVSLIKFRETYSSDMGKQQ